MGRGLGGGAGLPSYDTQLTQLGGGEGPGMGGMRMRGMMGGGNGGGPRPGGAPGGRGPVQATQVSTTLYWLYQRPGGAFLVLTLDGKGVVNTITLNGTLGFGSGRTSKGVTLGTDYMSIVRQYGYPDQSASNGATLVLTYVDAGVRFQLEGMRVNQITIGSYVAAARVALPTAVGPPRGPTGPGLGVDELKGYM